MKKLLKTIPKLLFILLVNPFTIGISGFIILIITLGWLPTLGILLLFISHNSIIYQYLKKTVNYHLTLKSQKNARFN